MPPLLGDPAPTGPLRAVRASESPPKRPTLLDVGQGSTVVVQGRGASIIFDGVTSFPRGVDPGQTTEAPVLAALGVARLDLVIASHADLDHRGGLRAVLERIPTDRLWLPAGSGGDRAFAALLAEAEKGEVAVSEKGRLSYLPLTSPIKS